MTPTERLKQEYKIILQVLAAAEREARTIQKTGKMDAGKIGAILDFLVNFADRCHRAKEKKYLFPKLRERCGPREAGIISVLLEEHAEGRHRIRMVERGLSRAAGIAEVRENLLACVALLREHIHKSENVLLPVAEILLTPDDRRALNIAFDKVEADLGDGVYQRYTRLAHKLAQG